MLRQPPPLRLPARSFLAAFPPLAIHCAAPLPPLCNALPPALSPCGMATPPAPSPWPASPSPAPRSVARSLSTAAPAPTAAARTAHHAARLEKHACRPLSCLAARQSPRAPSPKLRTCPRGTSSPRARPPPLAAPHPTPRAHASWAPTGGALRVMREGGRPRGEERGGGGRKGQAAQSGEGLERLWMRGRLVGAHTAYGQARSTHAVTAPGAGRESDEVQRPRQGQEQVEQAQEQQVGAAGEGGRPGGREEASAAAMPALRAEVQQAGAAEGAWQAGGGGTLCHTLPFPLAHSGRMANLTVLNLSSKKLNGSVPATMGTMTSVKHLYLQSSFLSSSLPSTLGGLSALVDLGNSLQGTIPNTFSQLTNLEQLSVPSHPTPSCLLHLPATTLTRDFHRSCRPRAPCTAPCFSCCHVWVLWINEIAGTLLDMANMTSLTTLNTGANPLTEPLPEESIGNLTNLQVIFNHLNGTLPRSITQLRKLSSIIPTRAPTLLRPLASRRASLMHQLLRYSAKHKKRSPLQAEGVARSCCRGGGGIGCGGGAAGDRCGRWRSESGAQSLHPSPIAPFPHRTLPPSHPVSFPRTLHFTLAHPSPTSPCVERRGEAHGRPWAATPTRDVSATRSGLFRSPVSGGVESATKRRLGGAGTVRTALLHDAPLAPPPQGYPLGSLVDCTTDAAVSGRVGQKGACVRELEGSREREGQGGA
ncbi:unnamed protein product [Closterium sp. NIES-64]|nr:unnamed protein product [Closterium sp. NIES-64]